MAQVYGVELPIMSPLLFIFTVVAAPLGEPVIPRVRVIILKIVLQGA
jgi:Na+/H+-dicarboxylate symporter